MANGDQGSSDDTTRIVGRPTSDDETRAADGSAAPAENVPKPDAATELLSRRPRPPETSTRPRIGVPDENSPPADSRTRIHVPGGTRRPESAAGGQKPADAMEDPVVGWLVVIDGPGKGNVRQIGYGFNSIGTAPTERVTLDFGDQAISQSEHAAIAYDPRSRKYSIAHGKGKNLTYVGGEVVMAQRELEPYAEIGIGETLLKFIPLCGPDFEWQDLKD